MLNASPPPKKTMAKPPVNRIDRMEKSKEISSEPLTTEKHTRNRGEIVRYIFISNTRYCRTVPSSELVTLTRRLGVASLLKTRCTRTKTADKRRVDDDDGGDDGSATETAAK